MARFRPHPVDVATGLTAAAMALAAALIASMGPTRSLPVGWGWDGMADVFAPREAVALLTACAAVVVAVIGAGMCVAANTATDPAARLRFRLAQTGLVALAALGVTLAAAASLNGVLNLAEPLPLAVGSGALILVIGLVLRVVRGLRAWHKAEGPSG